MRKDTTENKKVMGKLGDTRESTKMKKTMRKLQNTCKSTKMKKSDEKTTKYLFVYPNEKCDGKYLGVEGEPFTHIDAELNND